MATITLLAENNCAASAIAGSSDAFSVANLWWQYLNKDNGGPLFETKVVTLDGQPVTAHGGITLSPSRPAHDIEKTDLILLPALLPPFDFKTERIEAICEWTKKTIFREKRSRAPAPVSFCWQKPDFWTAEPPRPTGSLRTLSDSNTPRLIYKLIKS